MFVKQLLAVCAWIMLSESFVRTSAAQGDNTAPKTTSDGVYTAAQAGRGKTQYQANCSECHSNDLSGGEGRPLRGDVFRRDWTGKDLRQLFDRAKTMPPGAASGLPDEAYIEILAYVLQANSFPAGTAELTVPGLKGVRVEDRDSPGAVPNFSLVQVIGCLSEQGPDGSWILARTTDPVRTTDAEPSKEDQVRSLQSAPLGAQTLRLMYVFPNPAPLHGHKVEAKGLLMREANETRVNVTSLQSVAPTCGS
jgi:mono/diheme cytochrome c family protein